MCAAIGSRGLNSPLPGLIRARDAQIGVFGRGKSAWRIAIARHAKPIILDEPTAALDVSVQAVVLDPLQDLKQSMA